MTPNFGKPFVFIDDITNGQENLKISFINERNFQTISEHISYIPYNVLTSETLIEDFESIPLPCSCENHCNITCNCAFGTNIAYENGLLSEDILSDSTKPILECSDFCSCKYDCPNRVVQHGITNNLQVFMTEHKGFGVQTLEFIPRLKFVCEYAGELIDKEETEKRMKSLSGDKSNYIYVLKESSDFSNIYTVIDPSTIGNVGRYINHSCSPNLVPIPVRSNSMLPRICFFAERDIMPYEELTYNYETGSKQGQNDTNSNAETVNPRKCYCLTVECCGILPFNNKCLS